MKDWFSSNMLLIMLIFLECILVAVLSIKSVLNTILFKNACEFYVALCVCVRNTW